MTTKIASLIKKSGLKKEHIAEKAGVSVFTICNWCKGQTYPDMAKAYRLKKILKLSHMDELIDKRQMERKWKADLESCKCSYGKVLKKR